MSKILYVVPGTATGEESTGCFRRLDPIFYADVNIHKFATPARENEVLNAWLDQFGGRLIWTEQSFVADYIEFDDETDAVIFKLKFGL